MDASRKLTEDLEAAIAEKAQVDEKLAAATTDAGEKLAELDAAKERIDALVAEAAAQQDAAKVGAPACNLVVAGWRRSGTAQAQVLGVQHSSLTVQRMCDAVLSSLCTSAAPGWWSSSSRSAWRWLGVQDEVEQLQRELLERRGMISTLNTQVQQFQSEMAYAKKLRDEDLINHSNDIQAMRRAGECCWPHSCWDHL